VLTPARTKKASMARKITLPFQTHKVLYLSEVILVSQGFLVCPRLAVGVHSSNYNPFYQSFPISIPKWLAKI
jgi:hypothetical protein